MKTFKNVSETTNKCLMRCAGVIRKEGWSEDAVGMYVALGGPMFIYEEVRLDFLGFYSREYIEEFMDWQEENFG